ncbi:DNA-binding transcriptional regulator, LysR family [Streptomyces sp. Ag82_O1-12]|uniref:LysR family transcriptional regulator n=1 Tax=unclassified Streptomyces TaxID=2593676 RepID=UPI000BD97CEB|nr:MULTISPECIES: LysR family transcriptional regulator [unclassified Streptomyces]SMQ14352.1 DNA-binding transcriptional regulator, LysR family [Streptomyces sp. Ag82_O1-12]SOD43378.1 DNA-binding transcriptional regulator, LysR family [Streptomyces sp. Ag82_G6-1]
MSLGLRQLRAFVAVVDAGGFTSASDEIGLTQSAVSHAVAALEREIGAALISRGRDGVRLTGLGERILVHARAALRQVELIEEEAAAVRGLRRGRLRIGGFPSACQLLPPLIAELRRIHPGIEVALWEGTDQEVAQWLADGLIDLGMRASLAPPAASDLVLAADRMVAVVDKRHPLAAEPDVTLADLQDDPLLLSDGGCEPLLDELHAAAGLPLRVAQRVREMATLLAMVRAGLGVTVVPELSLASRQGIAALPLRPASRRRVLLDTPAGSPPPATVQAFQDILRRSDDAAASRRGAGELARVQHA